MRFEGKYWHRYYENFISISKSSDFYMFVTLKCSYIYFYLELISDKHYLDIYGAYIRRYNYTKYVK